MKPIHLYTSAIVASFAIAGNVFAQTSSMSPYQGMQNPTSATRQPIQRPDFMAPDFNAPAFANFPTPEEMARMTPPEPMTEERIRQRYAKIKENIQKSNEQDRKEAEKYAQDFSKYQKYQAEQLRKIMAQAEQQRSNMLTKIAQQEQRALERFRQQQKPQTIEPAQY